MKGQSPHSHHLPLPWCPRTVLQLSKIRCAEYRERDSCAVDSGPRIREDFGAMSGLLESSMCANIACLRGRRETGSELSAPELPGGCVSIWCQFNLGCSPSRIDSEEVNVFLRAASVTCSSHVCGPFRVVFMVALRRLRWKGTGELLHACSVRQPTRCFAADHVWILGGLVVRWSCVR